ncbi:RsmB/NOP family class I SAM-dependent RNA methyltransferase [Cryptosporangium sp. NPDC048952]|uniref:RsmB/NOP family class I SAM-dependent RNA methyltransferase n=1 Tax=Cryptosporangium sp. NPDC048952 TaxID=3363961 RepID=UPI0037248FAF
MLVSVAARDAYANLALPPLLVERRITGRDAAFVTELTYGTLRHRGTLDAILAAGSSRPIDKVDLRVLQALRLGAYQLLFTRVPDHAAVAGTVEVARVALTDGPARFVNAVLRRVAERALDEWLTEVTPPLGEDPIGHLAIRYSHPEWVVRAVADALGEDTARLGEPDSETAKALAADNERPGVDLAARPGRIEPKQLAAEIQSELGRWTRPPAPTTAPAPDASAATPVADAAVAAPASGAVPAADAAAATAEGATPAAGAEGATPAAGAEGATPAAGAEGTASAASAEGVAPAPPAADADGVAAAAPAEEAALVGSDEGPAEGVVAETASDEEAEGEADAGGSGAADDGVAELLGRWSPVAVKLPEGAPGNIAAIADGRAHVQDEGSQLCAWTLATAPLEGQDNRWLDLCAGPGGKAGLLASIGADRGAHLLAVEVTEHRAKLVEQAVEGMPATVLTADGRDVGTHPDLPEGGFDRVLVDAPCTGLGALRRRPEARWRKEPGDVPALAKLQRELLTAALKAARPGGIVAYVTCSPHLAETRVLVADVCRRTGAEPIDVRIVPEAAAAADLNPTPERVSAARAAALQLWPHRHGTDAMFLSLLRKPVGGHD